MSAKGVPGICDGSGVTEGLAVGKGGGGSIDPETRPLLGAATLLRFLGDAFLVGEAGSGGKLGSASNICDGSTVSLFRVFRLRVAVRNVEGASAVC